MPGHLYALLFNDGVVKVGRSKKPTTRIKQHQAEAARHGKRVKADWISPHVEDDVSLENQFIDKLVEVSPSVNGREYFEVDFLDVVKIGVDLAGGPAEYSFHSVIFTFPQHFSGWLGWNRMLTATDHRTLLVMADMVPDRRGNVRITGAELAEILDVAPLTASKSLTRMHRVGVLEKIANGCYRICYERGTTPEDDEYVAAAKKLTKR